MPRDERPKSSDKIRVIILPGQDPVGEWMATVVNLDPGLAMLGSVRDLEQVLPTLERLTPDVVLVDLSSGILQVKNLLSRIAAPMSGAAVIVVATNNEVDQVRQAMLYGAQGFLLKPFGEAELLNSVRQAYELVAQRRAELSTAAPPPTMPGVEPNERADVVAVYSPKGGVGCTTVAINLAVALQKRSGQRVTLVDSDLGFGDVDTALNLPAETSMATLLPRLDSLDDNSILEASLPLHRSGIRVLPAPAHLDMADTIEPEDLRTLLLRLQGLGAGYVVVDTWSRLDDRTLAILDACKQLVLVTTPQVTALRNTHRFLEVMDLLGYDREGIVLVLNHCYHRSNIRQQDVERALGHPVSQILEHEPAAVTSSLNSGMPLVEQEPNSAVARGIQKLARLVEERKAEYAPLKPARALAPAAEAPALAWRTIRRIGRE
jgi:pilus assembly protein CpaE